MKRIFLSFFLFTMASIVTWQLAFSPLVEWLIVEHFDQELDQYYRRLIKGLYSMLIEDIDALPPDQWDHYIKLRQPQFGYPIGIEPLASLDLQDKDLAFLKSGNIVVEHDGESFYKRLGNSDQVVTMGPLGDFKAPLKIEVLLWGMVSANFALMALIWTFPFWRKLRRISQATEAFGQGDFTARAKMAKHSTLFPLAKSFNNMAEQIQRLIGSHKELTQAVSHELRTPISRIRFGMEMLGAADDTKERHKDISEINKDVDELETLVTELLVYARFDREKPTLNPVELPVAPWLANIADKAGKSFPHIQINHHIASQNQEDRVSFDPHYMARALGNLIQNALKYATHRVEISFERRDVICQIHVDDDGPGIPEADQKRIFKPFIRLDSSRSRDTGGYGLGLAIVSQVVAWHDGDVYAGESPLGGARFTIRWK